MEAVKVSVRVGVFVKVRVLVNVLVFDGVNDLAGIGSGEHMKPGVADAYTNVFNAGLPGGLMTAEQAADKMEEARQKGMTSVADSMARRG